MMLEKRMPVTQKIQTFMVLAAGRVRKTQLIRHCEERSNLLLQFTTLSNFKQQIASASYASLAMTTLKLYVFLFPFFCISAANFIASRILR